MTEKREENNLKAFPMLSSLSVFFPCYNDEGTIASTVLKAFDVLRKITDNYEVIVVDDGSSDNSLKVLDELKRHYNELKIIKHNANLGYGCALRSGFANCSKDFIFYTDGDGQYDVYELLNLVNSMSDGVDIVNGYKIKRSDPVLRKVIGRAYHNSMKLLFDLQIRDVDCDFRLFRRHVFDKISLISKDGSICVEVVKKCQDANFKFVEVPVHHHHRASGTSQFFNLRRIYRSLKSVFFLWFKTIVQGKQE